MQYIQLLNCRLLGTSNLVIKTMTRSHEPIRFEVDDLCVIFDGSI